MRSFVPESIQRRNGFTVAVLLALVLCGGRALAQEAGILDPPAASFMLKCAGCHTVGGGELTGPDLKDAALWGMGDLTPKIKLMEKEVGPLSDGEIRTFAEFLKHPQVRERLQAEEARMAKAAEAKYEKGDPRKGAALFLGRAAFKNRGPACAACHHAGSWGGNFGPDLRGIHERMGTTALVSACEKTQFRVMDAAYRAKPVTRQEAIHLAKYLEAVESVDRGPEPGPSRVWAGALGFGLLSLGGIAAYYRRRPGGRGK